MKKSYFISVLCILFTLHNFAQSPQGIKYQAVVRDADENIVRSQAVGIKFTIHQSSETGTVVYTETFSTSTNTYGLVNLDIGTGNSPDDFSSINWENGPYFVETAIDISGGTNYTSLGVSEFSSTPYALYSNTAGFADSADYNSLQNKPITITQEEADKIDLLSVTTSIDLEQMSADVAANNTKVSFPGFGTEPGKALEGNNFIWQKSNNDIFYNSGNVGIGVATNSSFGGSKLHVGGGILYDGIPSTFAPGLLYYDNSSDGVFHYIDNNNNNYELGPGAISYNDTLWKVVNQDVFTDKYVLMQSSFAVGFDAIPGENFGFNTLILKENNLRILFDDTDDPAGTMPSNDWQIEVNESTNGGTSHFAILDITNDTKPFKIMANAPSNSFYISETGKVGIGTNAPSNELTVNGVVKASEFIGDGSGLTGITGGTGGLSSLDSLTFGADTDSDNSGEIAFQTQNSTRMTITNDGKVGIGTNVPSSELEVTGSGTFENVSVSGTATVNRIAYNVKTETPANSANLDYDVTQKTTVLFNSTASQIIEGFTSGISGQEIIIVNQNANVTIKHNGTGTQKILLPGSADIVINGNESARFICDGTSWYCIGLSN